MIIEIRLEIPVKLLRKSVGYIILLEKNLIQKCCFYIYLKLKSPIFNSL